MSDERIEAAAERIHEMLALGLREKNPISRDMASDLARAALEAADTAAMSDERIAAAALGFLARMREAPHDGCFEMWAPDGGLTSEFLDLMRAALEAADVCERWDRIEAVARAIAGTSYDGDFYDGRPPQGHRPTRDEYVNEHWTEHVPEARAALEAADACQREPTGWRSLRATSAASLEADAETRAGESLATCPGCLGRSTHHTCSREPDDALQRLYRRISDVNQFASNLGDEQDRLAERILEDEDLLRCLRVELFADDQPPE